VVSGWVGYAKVRRQSPFSLYLRENLNDEVAGTSGTFAFPNAGVWGPVPDNFLWLEGLGVIVFTWNYAYGTPGAKLMCLARHAELGGWDTGRVGLGNLEDYYAVGLCPTWIQGAWWAFQWATDGMEYPYGNVGLAAVRQLFL
jgi:hypothetical protein